MRYFVATDVFPIGDSNIALYTTSLIRGRTLASIPSWNQRLSKIVVMEICWMLTETRLRFIPELSAYRVVDRGQS